MIEFSFIYPHDGGWDFSLLPNISIGYDADEKRSIFCLMWLCWGIQILRFD